MGFYIRKSINVGPFRFNLSKSGVGISTGIKGFRVGTGPRGNYIHMGRGGFYYRKTFSNPSDSNREPSASRQHEKFQDIPDLGQEPLNEIESSNIMQLVDSSSAELVAEMNKKRQMFNLWPYVAVLGTVLTFFSYVIFEIPNLSMAIAIFTVVFTMFIYIKDKLKKTTVLLYEFEPEIESLYKKLHEVFKQLSSSSRIWHIEAEGIVRDHKRNAGATSVIKRTAISLGTGNPPNVKTNISVPYIPVGKQTLYFFPDMMIVFEPHGVGAVSYSNLNIIVENTKFIEEENVPADTKIVDTTWKYVNKKGGPDKRFKDNRELPVVLYEDINLTSATGLNERIEISKTGYGEKLSEIISMLAKKSDQNHNQNNK